MAKSRRAPDVDDRKRRPDDDDDAPVRKVRDDDEDDGADEPPEKPRKKRKSSAGPVKLILKICAGVAGSVLLLILLVWIYSPVGSDPKLLCYFPEETTSLSGYDVAEGGKIAKLKDVHETLTSNYKFANGQKFTAASGVEDKDVDKYMTGTAAGDSEEEKDLPPQERRGSLTVVRFKRNVDTAKFIESFNGKFRSSETKSRDGKTYYQLQQYVTVAAGNATQQELNDDISYFFPDSRTLVYGTTRRETEEALEASARPHRRQGRHARVGRQDGRNLLPVQSRLVRVQRQQESLELHGVRPGFHRRRSSRSEELLRGDRHCELVGFERQRLPVRERVALHRHSDGAAMCVGKINTSLRKAQSDIWQGTDGKPSGLEDPFNPKQGKGRSRWSRDDDGTTEPSSEQTKDILAALSEYASSARAYRRGRLVIIEGTIPHGMPEQGIFEKFWAAVSSKYKVGGFGGMMGGMGGHGMAGLAAVCPGPPGGGMPGPPPGVPGGPPPGVPGPG